MGKIRKRIIREKAVIGIYQSLIHAIEISDVVSFLDEQSEFKKDSQEYNECLELIHHVLDEKDVLIENISLHLKKGWSVDRLAKMELAILLEATYELKNEVNEKQIIMNEAVEIAKKYCDDDSYKFINGVLNNI